MFNQYPENDRPGAIDNKLVDHRWCLKCGKTKKSLMFLAHFDVICNLLLNRPTTTWNLFVLYNDQKKEKARYTYLPRKVECSKSFASLGFF